MADRDDVRRLALALPEAVEDADTVAFRVDGKLVAVNLSESTLTR